ncbi:MAG: exonuclease subunit SbcD, partial [Deltaproteobacteria bacterium]|nr:exonuclease subunit SbcD [Deltaproteobacteria bacterium]
MKMIHTSDWHLGQNFMFKDRKKEHEKFLEWLVLLIEKESADVLIVAGDIFDTISPPNYALKMYYSFLARVSSTTSCHTVIVGGNHDSVSTLNAPKNILKALNVHVTGGIPVDINDEVIVIKNSLGEPSGIICAVPFLRDRDIRKSVPGESYQGKSRALLEGIKQHYALVKDAAIEKKAALTEKKIPVVATGHLFAEGGDVKDEEGLREIHVGSLGKVTADTFPKEFDYLALGHLHRPQKVGEYRNIRYSGAPIPLSFSEADNTKQVVCI